MAVSRVPTITIGPTPPVAPAEGDLWWSPTTGQQCVWYDDGTSIQWVISNWGAGKTGGRGPQGIPGPPGPPALNMPLFNNVADLRGQTIRYPYAATLGYYQAGDKGGGPPWQWMAADTTLDDGFMTLKPNDIVHPAPGRYKRVIQAGASTSLLWSGAGVNDPLNPGIRDHVNQIKAALKYGAAVDASGGEYYLTDCNIDLATYPNCPGIFSDGTAVFRNYNPVQSHVFFVGKPTKFYFRNLKFMLPVSLDPNVSPNVNRAVWFSTTGGDGYGEDWEVSGCYAEGGINAFVVGGGARNYRVVDNFCEKQWSDGISGPNASDGAFLEGNIMFDGGIADQHGPNSPSGAIRIGTDTSQPTGLVSIQRNMFKNWSPPTAHDPVPQSIIDCYTSIATALVVSGNISIGCKGTIEIKTGPWNPINYPPPVVPEIYKGHTLDNNTFIDGGGITAFYTNGVPTTRKGGLIKISSNHFSNRVRPGLDEASNVISAQGYDKFVIETNVLLDTAGGIFMNGIGSSNDVAYDSSVIGNVVDAVGSAFQLGGGTMKNLTVMGNRFWSEATSAASLEQGITQEGLFKGNVFANRAGFGFRGRDMRACILTDNEFIGANNNALEMLASNPTDNIIEKNRFRTYVDQTEIPMVSVTAPTPGAGLTDGVRTFTVTNANTGEAAVFRFTVAGGTIVGAATIVKRGKYAVFPAAPTVTVDVGIVGGAVFAMVAAAATVGMRINGTNNRVMNNSFECPIASGGISGSSSGLISIDNVYGISATDPRGVWNGYLGAIVKCSALNTLGIREWLCVNSNGTIGGSDWRAITGQGMASRLIVAAGNVTMNLGDSEIVMNKTVAAATTVTLPLAAPFGWLARVSDGKGDAAANNISVQAGGGGTINGAGGLNVLNVNYQSRLYRSLGANAWQIL